MATVFTYINNVRERQVLEVLIESYGFDVLQISNHKSAFVQLMQYEPEYLIIEIPQQFTNHLSLIRQIKSNRKTREIKVLCYGDHEDTMNLNILKNSGAEDFHNRPITTEMVREFLESRNNVDLKATNSSTEYKGELEDTAVIMDPQTPTIKRIAIMVNRIGNLLAFPFTVAKVISVTESDKTGAKELAQAIELDPVVVSSVLKVANSVEYGKVGSSISSVKDAIIRLGFTETKNISISLSVMKIFSDEVRSIGFNREQFWYHSLAVAVIAGKLAKKAGYPHPEIAFVCGLLHDFGIILLDEFFPTYLHSTLHKTTETGGSFLATQKEMWGITHNEVVVKLFTQWNMPEEVQTVIASLISFSTYENEDNKNMEKLVHIIGIADIIAKSLSFGRECDEYALPILLPMFESLRCPVIKDDFYETCANEINTFSKYLGLKNDTFSFTREISEEQAEYTIVVIDMLELPSSPYELYTISSKARVIKVANVTEFESLEEAYDLIMCTCPESTRPTELTQITTVSKKKGSTLGITNENRNEYTPVLIIGGAYDENVTLPENVTQLPTAIDLRIVSFSIESLLLGHPFDLHQSQKDSSTVEHEQIEALPTERKLSFTTDILNRQILVINLQGDILTSTINELKHIVAMILNKTKYICINFTDAHQVEDEIVLILDTFRQNLQSRGAVLTLCNLGHPAYNPLNSLAESKVVKFVDKAHLVKHVNSIINVLKKAKE